MDINSKLILGTWQFGGDRWQNVSQRNCIETLEKSIECGINAIDTATAYGNGESERVLASALKNTPRDKYKIYTKVFADMLSPEKVIKSCDFSLDNLKTDYIDLLQIHWPAGSFGTKQIPISETLDAFNQLKRENKIKAIGISNFSIQQIKDAQKYATIDTLQPAYSLFWRHIEKEIYPYCKNENIQILAYSPLAQGLLAGKFNVETKFQTGDSRNYNKLFTPENIKKALEATNKLKVFAKKYDTTLANLAISWLLHQDLVYPIVGSRLPEQIEQTSKALTIKLDSADIKAIGDIGMSVAKPFLDDPQTHHFGDNWEDLVNLKN